eukprot:6186668-Pleurochrysis_carterae.AAC.2
MSSSALARSPSPSRDVDHRHLRTRDPIKRHAQASRFSQRFVQLHARPAYVKSRIHRLQQPPPWREREALDRICAEYFGCTYSASLVQKTKHGPVRLSCSVRYETC